MAKKYLWEEWSDGHVHHLEEGVDFTSLQGLRSAAQQQALRRDGKYRIRQEIRGLDNRIIIMFVPNRKVEPPASKSAQVDIAFINKLVKLTHPDKHPPERSEDATAVTARLMALRDELRKKEKRGY